MIGDPAFVSVRVIVVMALVIGVLAGLAWLLRRGAAGARARQGVAIERALSLGDRRSLVIVSVEGRRLLLGMTPTQVSLISDLGAPFSEALRASLDGGATEPRS